MLQPEEIVDLADHLRLRGEGYQPTLHQVLAAQTVVREASLQDSGLGSLVRLATVLCPIFSSTPDEQEQFEKLYLDWLRARSRRPRTISSNSPPTLPPEPPRIHWRMKLAVPCLVIVLVLTSWFLWQDLRAREAVGRVLADNQPLARATVKLRDQPVTTDELGTFKVSFKNRDMPLQLIVEMTGYIPSQSQVGQAIVENRKWFYLSPVEWAVQYQLGDVPLIKETVSSTPPSLPPAPVQELTPPKLSLEKLRTIPPPVPSWWQRLSYSAALIALVPSVLVLLWLLYRLSRRAVLKRRSSHIPPELKHIHIQAGTQRLFPSLSLRYVTQRLRQTRFEESAELDVQRTIQLTMNRGGLFSPVFGSKREPSYVALIDRATRADHQANMAAQVVTDLAKGNVLLRQYEFDEQPTILRKVDPLYARPKQSGGAIAVATRVEIMSLGEVTAKFPTSRLLYFAEPMTCFDPLTGKLRPWVETFEVWEERFLFTPGTHGQWGQAERILSRRGFHVIPLTHLGLRLFSHLFEQDSSQAEPTEGPTRKHREAYERTPQQWLERHPPSSETIAKLMADLRREVGSEGILWLAACAAYPEIHWALTLEWGARLLGHGSTAETLLPKLTPLVWFRHGFMPDWFRSALYNQLTAHDAERISQELGEIISALNPEGGETLQLKIATPSGAQQQAAPPVGRFSAWLQKFRRRSAIQAIGRAADPGNPMRDYVMLQYLSGKQGKALTPYVPKALLTILFPKGQPWLGFRPLFLFMAAGLVATGFWWWHDPVPSPLPSSIQAIGFLPETNDIILKREDGRIERWGQKDQQLVLLESGGAEVFKDLLSHVAMGQRTVSDPNKLLDLVYQQDGLLRVMSREDNRELARETGPAAKVASLHWPTGPDAYLAVADADTPEVVRFSGFESLRQHEMAMKGAKAISTEVKRQPMQSSTTAPAKTAGGSMVAEKDTKVTTTTAQPASANGATDSKPIDLRTLQPQKSVTAAGKRVALVVGIGAYDNLAADKQLKYSVGDAQGISAKLRELGYQVTVATNITRFAFNKQWQDVLDGLTKDDTFVLYFSGHGVQIDGQNYLLPRDIPYIEYGRQEQLKGEAISLNELLADLSTGNRFHPKNSVVILDACRDNPLITPGYKGTSPGAGLAKLPDIDRIFVMYAASSNRTAFDRLSPSDNEKYSVFTRTLIPLMGRTDLSVQEMSLELKEQVWKLAKNAGLEQRPAYYDGLHGRFCLPGCNAHLKLTRFREPIYFLTQTLSWKPDPGQERYEEVTVPKGFVTDFNSIPQVFWSVLRPDGEYVYAAVVHDYLYWSQIRSREEADHIFKIIMEDFSVNAETVNALYNAVRLGGQEAWERNKEKKARGEKRILIKFPQDPRISWADWKQRPGVFAESEAEMKAAKDGQSLVREKKQSQQNDEKNKTKKPEASTGTQSSIVHEPEHSRAVGKNERTSGQEPSQRQQPTMKKSEASAANSYTPVSQSPESAQQQVEKQAVQSPAVPSIEKLPPKKTGPDGAPMPTDGGNPSPQQAKSFQVLVNQVYNHPSVPVLKFMFNGKVVLVVQEEKHPILLARLQLSSFPDGQWVSLKGLNRYLLPIMVMRQDRSLMAQWLSPQSAQQQAIEQSEQPTQVQIAVKYPPTVTGKDGAPMVLVPAGEFTMGTGEDDTSAPNDERPSHLVFLDDFFIDQYEVTTAQYAKFIEEERQSEPAAWSADVVKRHARKPVVGVSWKDASAYCTWAGKRLPTEAEWEKAARGTDQRLYPWGNAAPGSLANFSQCCDFNNYEVLSDVGYFDGGKSPYGAYDMAGNAWEWVADWYDANYYSRSPTDNPKGPSSGEYRVLRGGAWTLQSASLRTTSRFKATPKSRNNTDVGFRCAQDAPK